MLPAKHGAPDVAKARIQFDVPAECLDATTKSPKSLAFPVVAIVINSIEFVKDGALCSTISAKNNNILHMLSSTWSGGVDIIGKANNYPKIYQLYIRGDNNWVDNQIQKAIDTKAEEAIIIDFNTNEVLFEKNADLKIEPASLTKIMTTYVVFDRLKNTNLTLENL